MTEICAYRSLNIVSKSLGLHTKIDLSYLFVFHMCCRDEGRKQHAKKGQDKIRLIQKTTGQQQYYVHQYTGYLVS